MHFNTAKALAVLAFTGTIVSTFASPLSNDQLARRGDEYKVSITGYIYKCVH